MAKQLNHPVRLSEGKIENFSDFLNLVLEYGLFFKWIYFKNRPRGNLLFLRSAMMVGTFSYAFFYFFYDFGLVLEGIEIDPVIALAGAVIIGYWHMTGSFYKKTKSCHHLHTEMLKATGSGEEHTAEILSQALAIELLTLDLWAHRQYRKLFADVLTQSMKWAYDHKWDGVRLERFEHFDDYIDHVNRGKLQAKEARLLMDHYQEHLLLKNKKQATAKAA